MPPRRSRSRPTTSRPRPDSARLPRPVSARTKRFLLATLVLGWSCLLCWIFWWPLWQGGGLVGGDLYPYYMPQKSYLAENLRSGVIPLWNSLVGFGYPVLGESQTAALYPPNLLLFSLLKVNTAYNVSQLGHYLFAFWGTFCLARRWGLQPGGSLLAATGFIYGWFPARICLEWSIIGGAWFVWILWGATAFLQSGGRAYALLVALFLGLDLLAGHYNLAFITLLTLIPFPWLVRPAGDPANHSDRAAEESAGARLRPWILFGALGCGFFLAAVQLLPTWELKSLSQRQGDHESFAPTYGHLPVQAISQLWMPWAWYGGEASTDEQLEACTWLRVPNATNQAEAQLYVGLIPLILALLGLCHPQFRRENRLQRPWGWLALAGCSLILATGWPTAWFPWAPGLSFFRGPGRYSMTAALSLCLLGGAGLDAVLQRMDCRFKSRFVIVGCLLMLTGCDLWTASRQYHFGIAPYLGRKVFYAVMLDGPPLKFLPESSLHRFFQQAGPETRIYAPGANLPTLLGVSALPVYLGLGPAIYESAEMKFDWSETDSAAIEKQSSRLKKFGVTHLLLESPLDPQRWPVRDLGMWSDRLLGVALGRQTPFHLYAVNDSPGRVSLEGEPVKGTLPNRIRKITIEPHRVRVEVECHSNCRVVLRDLAYPGWRLRDSAQEEVRVQDLFRGVDLQSADSIEGIQAVEWIYRPRSVLAGGIISFLTIIGLGVVSLRHRRRLARADLNSRPSQGTSAES